MRIEAGAAQGCDSDPIRHGWCTGARPSDRPYTSSIRRDLKRRSPCCLAKGAHQAFRGQQNSTAKEFCFSGPEIKAPSVTIGNFLLSSGNEHRAFSDNSNRHGRGRRLPCVEAAMEAENGIASDGSALRNGRRESRHRAAGTHAANSGIERELGAEPRHGRLTPSTMFGSRHYRSLVGKLRSSESRGLGYEDAPARRRTETISEHWMCAGATQHAALITPEIVRSYFLAPLPPLRWRRHHQLPPEHALPRAAGFVTCRSSLNYREDGRSKSIREDWRPGRR